MARGSRRARPKRVGKIERPVRLVGGLGDQGGRVRRHSKALLAKPRDSRTVVRAPGLWPRLPRLSASAIGIWQPMKPNVFNLNDASEPFQGLSTTRARARKGKPKMASDAS